MSDDALRPLLTEVDRKMAELRQLYTRLYGVPGGLEALGGHLYGPRQATTAEMWASCKCVPDRTHILHDLPKGGVVVEVGTQRGRWARQILTVMAPAKLYTIDTSYAVFQHDLFPEELRNGRLELLEGSSWDHLARFDDATFDMIYIDAGHAYKDVKRDSEVAIRKLKPGGTVIFNDFNVLSPLEFMPYGVARAAIELAQAQKLVFSHFAFEYFGYHDVALRRAARE